MTDAHNNGKHSRRSWLASALMGVGLLASYGTLAGQTLSFLLPTGLAKRKRRIFIGPVAAFQQDAVRTIRDLEGNEVLIKRTKDGFQAFSSTCPHLGCKVRWEADAARFFCPCHNGVFNADGVRDLGTAGRCWAKPLPGSIGRGRRKPSSLSRSRRAPRKRR